MKETKVILIILDGWGKGKDPEKSAIAQAHTPFVDSLYEKYPNSELVTYGEQVGLPAGQMGNSEVGHMNIGAGRIIYQELVKINKAIEDKSFFKNPDLISALKYAKEKNKSIHLMGLLSDGGIHSHINHLYALCDITQKYEIENVFIHAFMDGRDTDPKSGKGFISGLEKHIKNQSVKLATVMGRYYAMDRDKRWDRIKIAYDALVYGKGENTNNPLKTIAKRYKKGETDEFLKPIVISKNDNPVATIDEGDVILFFNFRGDRPRELTTVLSQKDMKEHGMSTIPLYFFTMTSYDDSFKNINVLFKKEDIVNTLGEVLSINGKTQLRIAETEKYAHVTYFFSAGREQKFKNERRILIQSPKVATYDLKPEMSANEVTDAVIEDIENNHPDFICLNFANADMVGHTGIIEAAKKAVSTVDKNLQRLFKTLFKNNYQAIIIADHGNSDYIINDDGSPNTAHSKNPVPCIYVSEKLFSKNINDGKLADIAPTILTLFDIDIPDEMTGNVLFE